MAAAAHDIWRAEHDEITGLTRLACRFLVNPKFRNADTLRSKCLSHGPACIVVRGHPHIGETRYSSQACDRTRHFVAAAHDERDQSIESLAGKATALYHASPFLRLVETSNGRIHVVIECEQIDASVGHPSADFSFGIEIIGLMAQVKTSVRGKLRPHGLDGIEQPPCHVTASKGALPS